MKYVPLPSQKVSTEAILTKKKSGLLVRMGVGKTVAALTAIEELVYNSSLVSRVLVVAPVLVATITWPEEIAKWDHLHRLRYVVLHGSKKDALLPEVDKADITIVNYEGLNWLWGNRFKFKSFDMVVFDESTYMKNATSARTKLGHNISRSADIVSIMTGAPKPNGLENLWGQVFCLDRGARLGSCITHFRNRYMQKVSDHVYKPLKGAMEEVVNLISDLCVVVEASDVTEIPDLTNRLVEFDLPPAIQSIYNYARKNSVISYPGMEYALESDQAQMQKLRQMASGFFYKDESDVVELHKAKVATLADLRTKITGGALIAIQYKHEVNLVRDALGYEAPVINSDTSASESKALIEDWNLCIIPNLIVHPASLSHGINMQKGGRDVVWFGNTWDLDHFDQLISRLRRRGQTSSTGVTNHLLVAKKTTDELMTEVIYNKIDSQEEFVKAVKNWKRRKKL